MKRKKFNAIAGAGVITLIAVAALIVIQTSSHTEEKDKPVTDEDANSITRVEVIKPARRDLVQSITLPATIEPLYKATLYAKAAGYLKSIDFDIGDWVKEGDIIAELEIPEMVQEYEQLKARLREAETSRRSAEADYKLQKLTYERMKSIWDTEPGAIAKQDVDVAEAKLDLAREKTAHEKAGIENARADLERTKALLEYGKIKAPFDGVITKRFVDPGALVQDAASDTDVSPVVEIMHTDSVRVFTDIPEPDIPLLDKGDKATIATDTIPGKEFSGEVTRYAESLDPSTRTMKTEIIIQNPEHVLLPGMFVDITLYLDVHSDAVTVPATALLVEKGKEWVYIVENSKVGKREVETGLDDGIEVEVIKGLAGDENIITGGNNGISEGESVKVSRKSEGE